MKKSKSVFALSVAGATLASAIGIASPAGAFNFVYDNVTYDVNTYTGSFNDLKPTLTAPNNALWGNENLADGLAGVVKGDLGYPNYDPNVGAGGIYWGPLFPYDFTYYSDNVNNVFAYSFMKDYHQLPNYSTIDVARTYATATAVPEPLTILGSITATGFVAAFNRIKNKKKE
jgi:hypothetical protein